MTWNKLLSMEVRVSHFSIIFWVQIFCCCFCVCVCVLYIFNYSLILFYNTAELKQWTPKTKTKRTQNDMIKTNNLQKKKISRCLSLMQRTLGLQVNCLLVHLIFYQNNNWKRNQLRLEPATFRSQAMLAQPSTMPSLSNIVIVLNIITLCIV